VERRKKSGEKQRREHGGKKARQEEINNKDKGGAWINKERECKERKRLSKGRGADQVSGGTLSDCGGRGKRVTLFKEGEWRGGDGNHSRKEKRKNLLRRKSKEHT